MLGSPGCSFFFFFLHQRQPRFLTAVMQITSPDSLRRFRGTIAFDASHSCGISSVLADNLDRC